MPNKGNTIMRKYYFLLFLIVTFFASTAQAEVTYKGKVFEDVHVYTIKGFLYDVINTDNKTKEQQREHEVVMPKIVKALVWFSKHHADKKVYKLEDFKHDSAFAIKEAVDNLVKVAEGEYKGFPAEAALESWLKTGQRVVLGYKEKTTINPVTNKKEKRTIVTFKLKPEEKETKNLVYIYEEERKKTLVKPLDF
jgi:hypothetical protein